jgi:tetratricopeptide (TPR) repeat protein
MDITWGFLGYLAAYRLSIIGVGALSIALGYRLFCKGLYPHSEIESTEFTAKLGESELSLVSAGPGLFFALFGVIVISVMIVQGNPELTLKKNPPQKERSSEKVLKYENMPRVKEEVPHMELTMRGNQDNKQSILYKMNQGMQKERDGNIDDAITLYQDALKLSTPAMNGLAWLYATERHDQHLLAKLLSNLSVELCPEEANYWDTFAEILFKEKQYRRALSAKKKAVALDPSFKRGMKKFEKFLNK